MKDFVELRLPELTLEIGKSRWFVQAVNTINCYWYCLLSDGSNELIAPMANTVDDTYIFNTRLEALNASMKFYELHNKNYPYIDEWQTEIKGEQVPSSQIESQPMVFE